MLSLGPRLIRGCQGVSRREFMRIGGLGAAGLALPDYLRAREVSSPNSRGKASRCIILFMEGGPSQLDTFDLKPNAPAEIRGEFKPIATAVPGMQICEHFPLLARQADKLAIVRSAHGYSDVHEVGVYSMLTGMPFQGAVNVNSTKPTGDDHPSLGSVVAAARGDREGVPPYVWEPHTPFYFSIIGHGGGWLGRKYDPFRIQQDPNAASFTVDALALPGDVPLERMAGRRGLLDRLARQADEFLAGEPVSSMDLYYQRALEMVTSPKARQAFDLSAEKAAVRDRYGRHSFGQGSLLARRLIEHGVSLVTVYWYDYASNKRIAGNVTYRWDTHAKNHDSLKQHLMPPFDRAMSALLEDLHERGLLESTLVVALGDFGRTPRLNAAGGRDHHARCFSLVFAGGGVRGGQTYGRSDAIAAYPAEHPVTPGDVTATIYQSLGISGELTDSLGRPRRITDGRPIHQLFT